MNIIVTNGRVVTMDATGSVAEAIAIRNGKIVDIGHNGVRRSGQDRASWLHRAS